MFKRIIAAILLGVLAISGLTACDDDATVANENLDTAANNFEVYRRVVFYNSILDKYIMVIEGWCSVDYSDPNKSSVVCKVGTDKDGNALVRRNAMSRADNVFCFYTQLDPTGVSTQRYRVVLKPEQIIPEPEIR
jgi:hypothetical protein